MKLGYFGLNMGPFCEPENMLALLRLTEDVGFESVWTGEHVVLIDPQAPPSPAPPETPFLDSVAALAFAAAHTTKLLLGSGIILLPQRNPVVLAKELAGVDILSRGRLLFGAGVGYVPGEYESLGIPFAERGARMDEHIEVLRTLWSEEKPEFNGRFTRFSGIQSRPLPVQRPHPPIHVGGMSTAAHGRAVAQGNGWYGFFQDLDATRAALAGLEKAAKENERPAALGKLEISITPPGPVDPDTAKRFEDLGVDRLILMRGMTDMMGKGNDESRDGVLGFIEETARQFDLG
ncbi:MAG: TIGR03619 family F420-dependent LLM class oxidoreductase [Myxococcota bacterium]|jgi:probable F420-dependent oxidoreductase|nr:TIGR03619 family F420-dependent LLM class oxidoreductase [Myxococcota bacterium]